MKIFDINQGSEDVENLVEKLLNDYAVVKVDYMDGDGYDFMDKHIPTTVVDFSQLLDDTCPICGNVAINNFCKECDTKFIE